MSENVKPFVLNDESIENSYGFYVMTAGIKMERFQANPVMLSDHHNSNKSVLGKWTNLVKQEGKLLGTPEFDIEDPEAKLIAGKVERNFIKGASMGLLFNRDNLVYLDGKIILRECELIEGTIIPVPSNPKSLRLYAKEGEPLTDEEIKSLCLSIQPATPEKLNLETDMKKIQLTLAALVALGFTDADKEGVEEALLNSKIMDLAAKNQTLTLENQKLTSEKEAAALKVQTELVVGAVTSGKITADKKDAFLSMAKMDFESTKAVLDAMPAKATLGAIVPPTDGTATEVKTPEDFEKLGLEAQLAFKANNPDAYTKLFSNS